MKRLYLAVIAVILTAGASHDAWGMDSSERKEVEFFEADRLDLFLAEQNYYQLKREIKPLYDGRDMGNKMAINTWTLSKLAAGLDPFLLYMDARYIFRSGGSQEAVAKGVESFMLCIALAFVAKQVMSELGSEVTNNVGLWIREKFKKEYESSVLSSSVLSQIPFEETRASIVEKLQELHNSQEQLKALPLPQWVDKITIGSGWSVFGVWKDALWWGTLPSIILDMRNTERIMNTIVASTKDALTEQIRTLNELKSWNDYFGIKKVEIASIHTGGNPNPRFLASLLAIVGIGGGATNSDEKEGEE